MPPEAVVGVTVPIEKRDKDLSEKLKAEWPAILRWMADGCLEWQRAGLCPPQAVIDATTQYLQTEDSLGTWLDEQCAISLSCKETSARLFASWKNWAALNGEDHGSSKQFSKELQRKGFMPIKIGDKNERGYAGVKIVQAEAATEPYGYRDA